MNYCHELQQTLFVISLIKIYIHNLRIHCMLSKKEREYLSGKLNLSNNYQRKIEHSIRKKLGVFRELELPLLRRSEVIGGEASYLGKLTSCQSGLTPLNSSFEISII